MVRWGWHDKLLPLLLEATLSRPQDDKFCMNVILTTGFLRINRHTGSKSKRHRIFGFHPDP